jgi:hypothetical protein
MCCGRSQSCASASLRAPAGHLLQDIPQLAAINSPSLSPSFVARQVRGGHGVAPAPGLMQALQHVNTEFMHC